MHADNRMRPKLTEFADILWGTGVLYQIKRLGSKGLTVKLHKWQSLSVEWSIKIVLKMKNLM